MMAGMLVRPARVEEAGALSEIAQAAKQHWGYPQAWMDEWRGLLTITPDYVRQHLVFVAEAERGMVGFFALRDLGAVWDLDHLWVLPGHMRLGVGRLLFQHAVEEVRRRRPGQLEIEADPNAEAFYLKMGARPIGERDAPVAGRARRLSVLALAVTPGESAIRTRNNSAL